MHKDKSNKRDKAIAQRKTDTADLLSTQFFSNRPDTAAQLKMRDLAAGSPQQHKLAQLQAMADQKANRTGLPDQLKSGIENLSGHALDDVKVHYNSAKPANMQAHAYAQGNDIHLAPGQEKHLPHEAWHVVQQKQGRVRPTKQLKSKVAINDDPGLEKEADVMGAKAAAQRQVITPGNSWEKKSVTGRKVAQRIVHSKIGLDGKTVYVSSYDLKKEFKDQNKAWAYDEELKGEFDPHARVATNHTYYHTASYNAIPATGNAGPHSLSHSSLSYRLEKRVKDTPLKTLRDKQVLSKPKFIKALDREKPVTIKPATYKRMILDYDLYYDQLEKLLQKPAGQEDRIHELLQVLMQMNPYTVYGKNAKPGKKALKPKNEKKENKFHDAFDSKAKFREEKGYRKYKNMRKDLYSDASSAEEISSSDESSEGEAKTIVNSKTQHKKTVPKKEVLVDYSSDESRSVEVKKPMPKKSLLKKDVSFESASSEHESSEDEKYKKETPKRKKSDKQESKTEESRTKKKVKVNPK